jgi:hypothetical protein
MTVPFVEYELQQGYVGNWLVAGPQEIPTGLDLQQSNPDFYQQLARKHHTQKLEFSTTPVERGPLDEGIFTIGAYKGEWNYYGCKEDHLVDLSASFQALAYVRAWAYSHLYLNSDSTVQFTVSTYGPVDIWINKKHVSQHEEFTEQQSSFQFEAQLTRGINKILIRFANVAAPDAVLSVALKLNGDNSAAKVQIPTLIPSISRRNQLEEIYDQIYLERDIHAHNNTVTLCFPETMTEPALADARLQTITGRIYGQAEDVGKPGSKVLLGTPGSLPMTPFQIFVMPRAWEYYESHIRITRRLNLWSVGRQRFSTTPYGYPEERKREALLFATTVENNLFAEIAKISLGKLNDLETKVINQSFENILLRRAGCEMELLGFLGALARFSESQEIPSWIIEKIRETALNFYYGEENFPSPKAGQPARADREIIFATCQILAGQLYPQETFQVSGLPGVQLQEEGEKAALEWMQKRGGYGFACWDSKELYSQILSAISYLIDLSKKEEVWELGSVLMDKMLFTIALNSFNGVYGSTQGQASTTDIKSGLLEPTSGITRIMWGMGIFNLHIASTVSLACMTNYELPPIIAEIAVGLPEAMHNKEQQAVIEVPVNKITYRTPEYMLSSAQSYKPGQPGNREHIWQATLGTQSIVFVNHPGCSSENDVHSPNYWVGNGILPRVAQHDNTLIAIYNNTGEKGMDFTHAYFPTREFDEFTIQGNTAFARKDDGYIALTAINGIEIVTLGPSAYREIRSAGKQNIWVCEMGRSSVDGSYEAFKAKVLAQEKATRDLTLEMKTLSGDALSFGWDSPMMYNNKEQPILGFLHYDNPFTMATIPSSQMDIANSNYLLRLKFSDNSEA